jgi:hypothetical protein
MRSRITHLVIGLLVVASPLAVAVEPALAKIAPPKVYTGASESFGEGQIRAQRLHGYVRTGGIRTRVQFQFGVTEAYGSTADDFEHPYGWNNGRRATAEGLAEQLDPDTTYHYRLVAWNEAGKTLGRDRTFHTPPRKASSRS